MKYEYVLDASALLSIVLDEPGQEHVIEILDHSQIHAINLGEVLGRLVRSGMPVDTAASTLAELQLPVNEGFGTAEAEFCGMLLGTRRDLGLSLGDCVCLTVAAWSESIAVTADRRGKELDGTMLKDNRIRVEVIR